MKLNTKITCPKCYKIMLMVIGHHGYTSEPEFVKINWIGNLKEDFLICPFDQQNFWDWEKGWYTEDGWVKPTQEVHHYDSF